MSNYQQYNLKEIREELNFSSQVKFAKAINIAHRTHQGYESQGIPLSKVEKVRENIASYAKSVEKEVVLEKLNVEKPGLEFYIDLEIVNYIYKNLKRFMQIPIFNLVSGFSEVDKLKEKLKELEGVVDKIESRE